jgi:hypothetical protein
MIYYDLKLYQKILYFQHQTKLPLLNVKIQTCITLNVALLSLTTPNIAWNVNFLLLFWGHFGKQNTF